MKTRVNPTFFLLKLFTCDVSLENIIKEQYELSRRANINISESDGLTEFERAAYVNLLLSDLKKELDKFRSPA
jgi:hypothetical protein